MITEEKKGRTLKQKTVDLYQDQIDALESEKETTGIKPSHNIRAAIDMYLKHLKKTKDK